MSSRSWLLMLLFSTQLLAATVVIADAPTCATPVTSATFAEQSRQVVTGTVGERLYLHTLHPDVCTSKSGSTCRATAYVISSDKVSVGQKCDGWAAVKFKGRVGDYYGWVDP